MKATVEALSKKMETPFVEVPDLKIPEWTSSGYKYQAKAFPCATIVIERITALPDGQQIAFIRGDNLQPSYAMVPNSFLLEILPPEKYADLQKKYREYQEKNLDKTLYFSGRVGSDPEIFAETDKGVLVPAFDFLGSKDKPTLAPVVEGHFEIKDGRNACYWDGFQAEFTTADSFCMGWHVDSIQNGIRGVYEALKKFNKDARLSIKTVFDIDPEAMIEAKPEHVQFGCMPSLNAYGMTGLDLPGHEVPFRSAGGHIHLSFNDANFKDKETYKKMVKSMDAILGVACVALFGAYDDARRRRMYGMAGEYRLPPHGLEYRVLSNAWLFHPVLANIVFDLGRTAAMFGAKDLMPLWNCTEEETIRVINECDVLGAVNILEANRELMIKLLDVMYKKTDHMDFRKKSEYVFEAMVNGMDSIIANPADIEGNWDLTKTWRKHGDGKGKNVLQTHLAGLLNKKV